MNNVEQTLEHLGVWKGTTLFFPKTAALEFIEACRATGTGILGIDGILIEDGIVHLTLDHILDLTSTGSATEPHSEAAYTLAKRFVKTRPDKVFFEIVCTD